MAEERFINDTDNGKLIDTKGELSTIHYSDIVDFYELWEFLNKLNEENRELQRYLDVMRSGALTDDKRIKELYDENKRLKQREETLLCEIENFQELLAKNDSVCYKRVIDLIDARIENGEEAIEWGKNMNADYGAMGFHIEMLKKLKKELEE